MPSVFDEVSIKNIRVVPGIDSDVQLGVAFESSHPDRISQCTGPSAGPLACAFWNVHSDRADLSCPLRDLLPNSARRSIAAVSISWVYFSGFHSIRNALPLHDVKGFQYALEACALIGDSIQVHDDLDGMNGKIYHPAMLPGDILAAGCHVNRRDLLVARDQLNPAEPAWRLLANPCVHLAARFALGLLVVEPVNPVDQFFSATASAPASASIMPLIVLL